MIVTPLQKRQLERIFDASPDGLRIEGRVARLAARDLVRMKLIKCISDENAPNTEGYGVGTYVITELGVSCIDKLETDGEEG